MPASVPEFQPRRFRSTVPYYARYRLGYPDRLLRRVAGLCRLKPGERVLDLGCGPGLLALGFARLGAAVVAVDPEPDMLAAGRAAAEKAALRIDFREGNSFDLPADLAAIKLVTMGRSFHWMDRAATLGALDGIVVAGGAVVLFGENHPSTAENRWRHAIRDVGVRYGVDAASYRTLLQGADGLTHESHLFNSAFGDVEGASVFVRNTLSADDIVGRVLSLSLSSPEKLGAQRVAFEAELRAALAQFAPDGKFTEIAEIQATIARRP